jgi:la-related protein 1
MASSADSHAAVAGAGMAPSDSPRAGKRAGGAAPWNILANAAAPVVVEVGNPIMDADSWPALPGLASPPPPPAAAVKTSPKADPPPSTVSFCISVLSS